MRIYRLVPLCVLLALASHTAAQTVTIAGSSTVGPAVKAAVKPFRKANPGFKVVVGGGGSSQGVKKAAAGDVDLGMASRPVKAKEMKAHPDLQVHQIGIDGIALIVHKSNPLEALTADQVQALFTGQVKNWSELGGADAPIELISADNSHGTYEAFTKHFGLEGEQSGAAGKYTLKFRAKGSDGPFSDAVVKAVDGNKATFAAMATRKQGLGYISIGVAARIIAKGAPLKMVSLDGVAPTTEKVASGAYPLQRPLNLLSKGAPNENAQKFLDFMLSPAGQTLIEDLGFLAVTGAGN